MEALRSRQVVVGVVVSGAVALTAYVIYRRWKASRDLDEGFSEKGSGEPMPRRVLVVGLDKSGKSCLLSALSRQQCETEYQPTEGFNVITVQNDKSTNLDIWEIGGSQSVRKYWPNFIQDTEVLVFIVDSADRSRFPDAYNEMHKLLGEPRLLEKPFVVLANKQDMPNAASVDEVKEALGLEDVKHHRVRMLGTSLTTQQQSSVDQVRTLLATLY